MDNHSYHYANGRVSVLSVKLLTKEKLFKVAESPSLESALKILHDAGYAGGMTLSDANEFERLLQREWDAVVTFVDGVTAEKETTDCFLLAADVQNLKMLMKQKYLRTTESMRLERGLYDADAASVMSDDYSFLPDELSEAMQQIDEEFYQGNRKPFVIDTLLSKAYYKTVLKCKNPEIRRYFMTEIDCKNILSFFRTKKAGLSEDYFESLFIGGGNLGRELQGSEVWKTANEELNGGTAFIKTEKLCKDLQREIIFPHRWDVDGILPLVNYFLAKQTEIENLRLALVCTKNKIDKGKTAQRFRELYV